MADVYDMVDEHDLRKIASRLELEKDAIAALLNTLYTAEEVFVRKLGRVKNLNVPQYLMAKSMQEKTPHGHYHRTLILVLQKAVQEVLDYEDSKGNNLLHYCAALSNYEAATIVTNKNIKIIKNFEGIIPYVICSDFKTKNLIRNYMTKYQYEHSSTRFFESVSKAGSEEGGKPSIDFYQLSAGSKKKEGEDKFLPVEPVTLSRRGCTSQVFSKLEIFNAYHFETNNLRTKKVHETLIEELSIDKYPGRLYMVFDKVVGMYSPEKNMESVFFVVRNNNWLSTTNSYEIEDEIKIRETVCVPITKEKNEIFVEMYAKLENTQRILKFSSKKSKKMGKFDIFIDQESLEKCHNTVMKVERSIVKKKRGGVLKLVRSVFSRSKKDVVRRVKMYLVYIAEEEIKHVEAPEPKNVETLLSWLKIKKVTPYIWFNGFVNVRGCGNGASQLWRRRLIRWKGINLVICNEYNGMVVEKIDMTTVKGFSLDQGDSKLFKNYVNLKFEHNVFEVNFDSEDAYEKFTGSLKHFLEL